MELIERLQEALGDRYTVERELGRGGMATVFLARDLKHDREVAVKVLHDDLAASIGAERFQREIHIAGRLTHPNILPLYDSGQVNGSLFYVMPYVEGESLRARIDREHQLSIDEAVRIACEVAQALGHAHRQGILHRDIKPENILLEDGHAVIADFGIARAMTDSREHITYTGISLGTPGYMSPEQSSAMRDIDGRSDQYSLGCVLYEMLVGQPPFTGPNAQAVMARHAMDPVPSLRTVRSTVPVDVEQVVFRALAKSPADRFPTMEEFAQALRKPGTGANYGTTQPSLPLLRVAARRPVFLVLALVPMLLGALAAWHFWLRPSGEAEAATRLNPRHVAVLYFDNESGDTSLAHVADGLTESLINELRSVNGLSVISRNGVAPLRESTASADSIARALSVGTLVRGTVDEAGDRVRVQVRLVDGNSGVDFRRASFDRPRDDLQAAHDSLARQVAFFLRERLGQEVRLQETRARAQSPEAWSLVQQAERTRKDAEALRKADSTDVAMRRLALADSLLAHAESLDVAWPAPVLARADLAMHEARINRNPIRRERLIARGLDHVARALRLDLTRAEQAEALELRGTLRYSRRAWGLADNQAEAEDLLRLAEQDLNRSTELDPSRATAWNALSVLLYRKYDRLGANTAAQRAYEADAFLTAAEDVLWRLYATSYDAEQFYPAWKYCTTGRARFPENRNFLICQLWLRGTNLHEPDVGEAWRLVDELKKLTPASEWGRARPHYEMLVALTLDRAGLADSARRVIERARVGRDVDPGGELIGQEVIIRTLIGDREEAIRLLQQYLTDHPDHREGFMRSPTWWWRSLQDDPRFRRLVG